MLKRTVLTAFIALLIALRAPTTTVSTQAATPRLVVFLVVDQMRGDYPVRYSGLLEHGLKRLTTRGAWYKNGAYPYLNTITCVGHSTIGTGTLPYKHGMISNAWYDRATEKSVTCNSDPESTKISYGAATGPSDSGVRMLMPTLADVMREKLHSRVATMSMKPRSAIGLAGHGGDFVTWFGDREWQTSSAFTKTPVPWFVGYLKGNPADRDSEKVWERLLPESRYQYEDDARGENGAAGWTAKFPHPLGRAGDTAFWSRWAQSPFPDAYLEEMAEAAVTEMKLGQEARTDFLGISFSMLDSVGHSFGPRSHEVQDVIARLDRVVGRLLDFLDEKVGPDNYVLAFSADHGVADIPEQIQNGGRVPMAAVRVAVETTVKGALGDEGTFVAAVSGGDIYFKPGVYDRLRNKPRAIDDIKSTITRMSGIARVLARDEISTPAARTSKDPAIRAAALSYYEGRSGDLVVIPKENWMMAAIGTTHGTLYPYDQRVPVLLYGSTIQSGVRDESAMPADLAPTVASIVGVELPSPDGRVLKSALKKR